MDLGATICTPQKPACSLCPWQRMRGVPGRRPGALSPQGAEGRAAAALRRRLLDHERSGEVALRRRPPSGLLGGMLECRARSGATRRRARPPRYAKRPSIAEWRWSEGVVRHVFTHFALELQVATAGRGRPRLVAEGRRVGADRPARRGRPAQRDAKVAKLALAAAAPAEASGAIAPRNAILGPSAPEGAA